METDLLFVYGTLNPSNNLLEEMNIKYRFIGLASVEGIKLKNTKYPSLVPPQNGTSEFIDGVLIQLEDAETSFAKLDNYEGYYPGNEKESLYLRCITDVQVENQTIKAYIYWFNFSESTLLKNSG